MSNALFLRLLRVDAKLWTAIIYSFISVILLITRSLPNRMGYSYYKIPFDSFVFHAILISICAFLCNHAFHGALDSIYHWRDKETKDALLVNTRNVVIIATLCPAAGFYIISSITNDESFIIDGMMTFLCFYITWTSLAVLWVAETSEAEVFTKAHTFRIYSLQMMVNTFLLLTSGSLQLESDQLLEKIMGYLYIALTLGLFILCAYTAYKYVRSVNCYEVLVQKNPENVKESIVLSVILVPFSFFILAFSVWIGILVTGSCALLLDTWSNVNICVLLTSAPLLLVPDRFARMHLWKSRSSLANFAITIKKKVYPEMLMMMDSLDVLRSPKALRAIYLDPMFRRNFRKVTELCDSLLIDLQGLESDISTASDLTLPVEWVFIQTNKVTPVQNKATQDSCVAPYDGNDTGFFVMDGGNENEMNDVEMCCSDNGGACAENTQNPE